MEGGRKGGRKKGETERKEAEREKCHSKSKALHFIQRIDVI